MRLARRLYDVCKELCEKYNLRAIAAGGPILTFQLSNGFHVRKIPNQYLLGDTASLEYATLLEWNNIYYEAKLHALYRNKREVMIKEISIQNIARMRREFINAAFKG